MNEESYVDILTKLKAAVESDTMMPCDVKESVLEHAYALDAMLFPYSA